MIRKFILAGLACLLLLAGCSKSPQPDTKAQSNEWKQISSGLSYREIKIDQKDLLIVKIDPKKFSFSIVENDPDKKKTIEEIAEENGAPLGFNGSFFTEKFQPTGLLRSAGKTLSEWQKADLLDGTLTIDENKIPKIYYLTKPDEENPPDFAIQSGPVLVHDGKSVVRTENDKESSRTVIGIDENDNVVLIIIKQNLLHLDNTATLEEIAGIITEKADQLGINVREALNLDGGTSSGIIIDQRYFPEMEKVQNIILVQND